MKAAQTPHKICSAVAVGSRRFSTMSLETGVLIGMVIGMVGIAAMTAFAVWSKIQEDKERNHQ